MLDVRPSFRIAANPFPCQRSRAHRARRCQKDAQTHRVAPRPRQAAQDFVQKLLVVDPQQRLSAAEAEENRDTIRGVERQDRISVLSMCAGRGAS